MFFQSSHITHTHTHTHTQRHWSACRLCGFVVVYKRRTYLMSTYNVHFWTHTHALSQDSKIFAGWKPIPSFCSLNGPVPFLLFRPTCTAGGDSILPVVSRETLLDTVSLSFPILPRLSATATVSNCFLLSCFSFFLPLPSSFFQAFFCGPFSYSRQMIGIDEHKAAFRGLTPSRERQEELFFFFFLRIFFFF